MSNIIEELIVKSGNGQERNGRCYPHLGSRSVRDWEKFAELIILECAKIADQADADKCESIGDNIKFQMGIKL